jgi:hypothetical protein
MNLIIVINRVIIVIISIIINQDLISFIVNLFDFVPEQQYEKGYGFHLALVDFVIDQLNAFPQEAFLERQVALHVGDVAEHAEEILVFIEGHYHLQELGVLPDFVASQVLVELMMLQIKGFKFLLYIQMLQTDWIDLFQHLCLQTIEKIVINIININIVVALQLTELI